MCQICLTNLIISITQTSKIVSQQSKILANIRTDGLINNLVIIISSQFALVPNDGTPNDNITTPCYLGNNSVSCTPTLNGEIYKIVINNQQFLANQDYSIGIMVINPFYSDNFQLEAYSGSQPFLTFGLINIESQQINCSVVTNSNLVGAISIGTFTFQIGKSPPLNSDLLMTAQIPQVSIFPNLFADNPLCTGTIAPNPTNYRCTLSTLFAQQTLTVQNIFPLASPTFSLKVNSLNNAPYNATWISILIQINDQFGREIKYCTVLPPAPTTLQTITQYTQTGWKNTANQISTVQHVISPHFSPLTTSSLMLIYNSALKINPNPPTASSLISYNSTHTSLTISLISIISNTLQFTSSIQNPLATIPLGIQIYVLYNSTHFRQSYLYPASNMILQSTSHIMNAVLSNTLTGVINRINISIALTGSISLSSVNDQISTSINIPKGSISCIDLALQSSITLYSISSCESNQIQIKSMAIIDSNSIWVSFKYINYYSQAPNLLTSSLLTLSGYQISNGNINLALSVRTCSFTLTNTQTQLGNLGSYTLIENLPNSINLFNPQLILTIKPPQNLVPLLASIKINNSTSSTRIVSSTINTNSLLIYFQGLSAFILSSFSNPNDYTIPNRLWQITLTDFNLYSSSICTVTNNPDYTPATSRISYKFSNPIIQEQSYLQILLQSVLKYVDNTSAIPIVMVEYNLGTIININQSACGKPGNTNICNKVSSNIVSSNFGGLETNVTVKIKNSGQPSGNIFTTKIINQLTGYIYETVSITYNLQPTQFQLYANFTGLYLQIGSLSITVTKQPNRTLSLTYIQADVNAILSNAQCQNCQIQSNNILISGIVNYFYKSPVRIRGIGSNGVVYAQGSVNISYPCPWKGCRICRVQESINSTGNLTCLKCFDSSLTIFNKLYQSQCYDVCPIQTYNTSISCVPCPNLCYACTETQCNQCVPTYFVYQNTCVQQCPAGYITNATHCLIRPIVCPKNCINCPKDNKCNQCDAGYYLLNDLCYTSCPDKYVKNPNTTDLIPKCVLFIAPAQASYFPFIFVIITVLWFIILAVFKCFEKRSLMMGNFVALASLLEWGSLLTTLVYIFTKNDPYNQTNTPQITLLLQALCFIILFSKIIINIIFLIYFNRNITPQQNFSIWLQKNPTNKTIYYVLIVLSIIISFQFMRIIYSRLFGIQIFFGRFNTDTIFKPINYFSFAYFFIVGFCVFTLSGVAIYNQSGYKTSLFYSAIELIIMELFLIIGSALDGKWGKAQQFFQYQVYKIQNNKDHQQDLDRIEVRFQQENGGSLHEFLKSRRTPKESQRYWVERGPYSQKNQRYLQESQQQSKHNLGIQELDEQTSKQLDQQTSKQALNLNSPKSRSSTHKNLFRWKIIDDWNKLKSSLPKQISNKSLKKKKSEHHLSKSVSKPLQKSPNKQIVSPQIKSIKKVSSVQNLSPAKVYSPLPFLLEKAVGTVKKNIKLSDKKYYYKIDDNIEKSQKERRQQSQQRTDDYQKYDRNKIELKKNSQQYIKMKENQIGSPQNNVSEIKNIFQDSYDKSLFQIRSSLNLKTKENNRYSQIQQQQQQASIIPPSLKEIQEEPQQHSSPNIKQQNNNEDNQQHQDPFSEEFLNLNSRRRKKLRPKKINKQTQSVYLQRLISSEAFKKGQIQNKNREQF